MRRASPRLLAPLLAPTTYRRWAFLVLGGATYWPYLVAAASVTWPDRWRTAGFFLAHLLVGMVVCTMVALTLALEIALSGLTGRPVSMLDAVGLPRQLPAPGSWRGLWTLLLAAAVLAGLLSTVAGIGAIAAFFAPVLLGPSPEERAARLERHARQLAERNRLARELHDSVGDALSVVTVQAAAAGTVLDTDPAFARDALAAIQTAARRALDDLDHVLGILRDEHPADHTGRPHRPTHRPTHR